jgi:Mrp family chromosome partitioning ATPase
VLSSGQVRNNPVRLLAQSSDLLHELTARFELVIIDGPPVMVGGDCWILSQHVDHTIMLVKWESTPVKAIRTALKQLTTRVFGDERSASTVAGIVLNMIDPQRSRVLANEDSVMFAPSIYNYHRSGER